MVINTFVRLLVKSRCFVICTRLIDLFTFVVLVLTKIKNAISVSLVFSKYHDSPIIISLIYNLDRVRSPSEVRRD